jgi:hypothetical protein
MIVRVTCPVCTDIAVSVGEVCVLRDGVSGDRFRFHCPRCGRSVEKRAVGRVAEMLLAAGALEELVTPLSLDDLAELRRDMETDDWLQRLLA